jgi:hypothetical protein
VVVLPSLVGMSICWSIMGVSFSGGICGLPDGTQYDCKETAA